MLNNKKPALRVGTKVKYTQRFSAPRYGKIVGSGTKNGMKVYDFISDKGESFWGYRDQFEVV